MVSPTTSPSPRTTKGLDHGDYRKSPRSRRRSPSIESDRKRRRADRGSFDYPSRSRSYHERSSWDRDRYEGSRRHSYHHPSKYGSQHSGAYSYDRSRVGRAHENGMGAPSMGGNGMYGSYQPRPSSYMQQIAAQQNSKSRRLYIGNIPYQAGLTDIALTQFFSALYVAGFRSNRPGEPLPVVSFWLHSDGKFGFMELRGEQEAVNMMQFNGVFLHGRPLRVNRPSDYRPEIHNPSGMNLVPDGVNTQAVMDLCNKLGGIVSAPAQLAAVAVTQAAKQKNMDSPASSPPATERAPAKPEPPAQIPSHSQASSEHKSPVKMNEPLPPTNNLSEHKSVPEHKSTLERKPSSDVNAPENNAAPVGTEESSPDTTLPTEPDVDCVVSLKDLVSSADLEGDDEEYKGIVEDVEDECGVYGKVVSVNIPRTGPWKGTAFVEFTDNKSAVSAVNGMRGRVFEGRKIEASVVKGCQTASEAANRSRA